MRSDRPAAVRPRVGLAIGAGVEHPFTRRLQVEAENIGTDLVTRTHTFRARSTRSIGVATEVRVGPNHRL